jgi:hypothetical protein
LVGIFGQNFTSIHRMPLGPHFTKLKYSAEKFWSKIFRQKLFEKKNLSRSIFHNVSPGKIPLCKIFMENGLAFCTKSSGRPDKQVCSWPDGK